MLGRDEGKEGCIIMKKIIKNIEDFLNLWPLTIVVPTMLILILVGAGLGW